MPRSGRGSEMDRKQQPPDDCPPSEAIEIVFAIPVYLTRGQNSRLHALLDEIVKAPWNQVNGHVHWVSGYGCKPKWSKADCAFLGKPVDPDAPDSGEPTFDDTVYQIETSIREKQ